MNSNTHRFVLVKISSRIMIQAFYVLVSPKLPPVIFKPGSKAKIQDFVKCHFHKIDRKMVQRKSTIFIFLNHVRKLRSKSNKVAED